METLVLLLPVVLFLACFIPFRDRGPAPLFSRRSGPMVSRDDLHQLITLFLMYFVLFMVPVAGRLVGQGGHTVAMATLFVVFISFLFRFKKLSDE